jgi:hypothetical protein
VRLLRRAYTILKKIHADHILDGITLPRHWHDTPAAMLSEYHDDHPIVPGAPELIGSVKQFLQFAIQVSTRLCDLHTKKVRHGALRPENLTISPDGKIWLQDFTCASLLFNGEKSNETRAEPEYLPYLAPESTGRVNRRVDYRSDFYSLGATLFHVITGKPLWASSDPVMNELDVANKHVTQTPPSTNFHPAIDAVICKLLAKMPEHRYQTCEGLLSDWRDIQSNPDAPFTAGKADQDSRFMIPQGLYGRENEKQQLYNIFEQTRDERCSNVVFLRGYAGVGKSALVKESVAMMQSPETIFCQGKFDQNKSVPFSAIVQGLRDLTRQILTESATNLEQWRIAIRSAIDGEVAVLLPLVPDLVHIIGVDSPDALPDLENPLSQEDRQKRVLTQFLQVFARRKTIIMFMDDLHWSSKADLQLLAGLVHELTPATVSRNSSETSNSMLLICAYRDNIVGPQHPVRTIFEDKVVSETIEVRPLKPRDTEKLVGDTLHRSLEECHALSKLINGRCRGNPFFLERVCLFWNLLIQMLSLMNSSKLINFNYDDKRWEWDLHEIAAMNVPEDIVEFLLEELDKRILSSKLSDGCSG